jgi:hypothetical protein
MKTGTIYGDNDHLILTRNNESHIGFQTGFSAPTAATAPLKPAAPPPAGQPTLRPHGLSAITTTLNQAARESC